VKGILPRILASTGRFGYCAIAVARIPTAFLEVLIFDITLGRRLHELRNRADLSLRELAEKVNISTPFLSDIELGRRFPSDEILAKLASALNEPVQDLKQYDTREVIADLKRLMNSSPNLALAFRMVVANVKSGDLTAEDIVAKLGTRKGKHGFSRI
jgi:transcriptional regulator with XRE-family HTH domain